MSATVKVTRNFTSLADLALVTKEDMRELGLLARERIVRRTLQSMGPNGVPFEPLSIGYAAEKLKHLGTAEPNLQVSGNMLNHMTIVDVTNNTVTLGWEQ